VVLHSSDSWKSPTSLDTTVVGTSRPDARGASYTTSTDVTAVVPIEPCGQLNRR